MGMYKIKRFSKFGKVVPGHEVKKDLGTENTPNRKNLYRMAENQSLAADNLLSVNTEKSGSKLTSYDIGRRKSEVRLNLENINEANKKFEGDPDYKDLSKTLGRRIDALKKDPDVKNYEKGLGKSRNGVFPGFGDRSGAKPYNEYVKSRRKN